MKRRDFVLAAVLAPLSFAEVNPELQRVKNVYLLPMSGALDQYLANNLTRTGQLQVVADPSQADAFFTDNLGEPFEKQLATLTQPPPEPKTSKKEKASKSREIKSLKDAEEEAEEAKAEVKEEPQVRFGGFNRARGNIFLVDKATKRVIWAYYGQPKNRTSDEMNRLASKITDRFKAESTPKK
jgi:hypothetical protein